MAWAAIVVLCGLRFCFLAADFPDFTPWMSDQAKFTDEGWWASAAVNHALLGHWRVPGDYNPGVALPVWPALLAGLFRFTGVSVVAARALEAAFSVATLMVLYALVRRYSHGKHGAALGKMGPVVAVLLMAASPFAFVFARLAILDTVVVFEFCLMLLVASYASAKRWSALAALPVLIAEMILTKTTAAVLVPAALWLMWSALNAADGKKMKALFYSIFICAVLPWALVAGYSAVVARSRYAVDYQYFFNVNAMGDVDWSQSLARLQDLLVHGFWVDRFVYPLCIAAFVVSLVWKRKLWCNPLFTSAWIALAAQAAFIFRRQEDYAPRYFLTMLVPMVLIVVLALEEMTGLSRGLRIGLLASMAALAIADSSMIVSFVAHRQYRFYGAAMDIRRIIRSDPAQSELMLGVSGSQISLMTGIAAISDAYGTEDMTEKVKRCQPGWYLVWNDQMDEAPPTLFRLEKVASYPVFDDNDRNLLILYRMTARAGTSSRP